MHVKQQTLSCKRCWHARCCTGVGWAGAAAGIPISKMFVYLSGVGGGGQFNPCGRDGDDGPSHNRLPTNILNGA